MGIQSLRVLCINSFSFLKLFILCSFFFAVPVITKKKICAPQFGCRFCLSHFFEFLIAKKRKKKKNKQHHQYYHTPLMDNNMSPKCVTELVNHVLMHPVLFFIACEMNAYIAIWNCKKNNNMWFGNTFATTYIFIANFLRFFVYIFKSLLNKVKQKIILFQFCVLCLHQQHCEMRKFARKTHSSTLVRLIFFYIFYVWYEILVNLRRFIMRHVGLQIQILELKGMCLGILEEIVHKSS